jgi:hypothetical protein
MLVAANQAGPTQRVALAVAEFLRSRGIAGSLTDVENWGDNLVAQMGLTEADLARVFAAMTEPIGVLYA